MTTNTETPERRIAAGWNRSSGTVNEMRNGHPGEHERWLATAEAVNTMREDAHQRGETYLAIALASAWDAAMGAAYRLRYRRDVDIDHSTAD